jgi:hypothetical protein
MGYREDVCVAYTKKGWDLIVEKIPEILNDEQIADVISFLNDCDDHSVNDDGDHCLTWSAIKTGCDDAQLLFNILHTELDSIEDGELQYFALFLGEDGSEENYGGWYDNPFCISTTHSMSRDVDSCDTWNDCRITPVKMTAAPTVVNMVPVVDDYTCTCGNTKCSLKEKSCWKCGAAINAAKTHIIDTSDW